MNQKIYCDYTKINIEKNNMNYHVATVYNSPQNLDYQLFHNQDILNHQFSVKPDTQIYFHSYHSMYICRHHQFMQWESKKLILSATVDVQQQGLHIQISPRPCVCSSFHLFALFLVICFMRKHRACHFVCSK